MYSYVEPLDVGALHVVSSVSECDRSKSRGSGLRLCFRKVLESTSCYRCSYSTLRLLLNSECERQDGNSSTCCSAKVAQLTPYSICSLYSVALVVCNSIASACGVTPAVTLERWLRRQPE